MNPKDLVELHAIARGQVQGVGFRATVCDHATALKLKGTVSNLPDGSVEIYAQGTRHSLDLLLQRLKHDAGIGSVDTIDTNFYPASKEYDHFSIIYGRSLKG